MVQRFDFIPPEPKAAETKEQELDSERTTTELAVMLSWFRYGLENGYIQEIEKAVRENEREKIRKGV